MSLAVILGMMPVGLRLAYEGGVFSFQGRVFFFSVSFGKRRRVSGVKRDIKSPLKKLLSRPKGKIFLKNAYTTLKRLIPRVSVPQLKLHILAAGEDPAKTAVVYGMVGAAMEQLNNLCDGRVLNLDIRAEVDFCRKEPVVTGCVLLRLHFYQTLWFLLCFGLGFWRDYRRQRRGV